MNISKFNPINFTTAKMGIKTSASSVNPTTGEREITTVDILDDKGNPITIELASIRSNIARDLFLELKANGIASDSEQFGLKTLIGLTIGWSDNLQLVDGESFPFTKENAEKLYLEQTWIGEQATAFVVDQSNYVPKI
jgi:hypothetical protein